jgi:hypothetical protein
MDHRRQSEAGQAFVIMTLAIVGLLVAVGLALDGGTLYLQRRRMQNAADAAAREGARQLYRWQVRAAYADDSSGEQALLSAVHEMAEANGVRDTDGVPGNPVNDNVTAYYVDSQGVQLSDIPIGESGSLDACINQKCAPEGSGRCCGVQAEVHTEFDTALIRLAGPSSAPVEAAAAGVFIISDGLGGLGDSALFALGTGCGEEQLTLRGDDPRVIGTAHSNDGANIPNDRPHLDRLVYVDAGDVIISGDNPMIDEEVDLEYPVDPNLPFTTTFYADYTSKNGTPHSGGWTIGSDQAGIHSVDGDLVVQGDNVDLSGLYYVEGEVTVQGDGCTLIETTIVATGKIDIRTDDVPYSPWPHPATHPWGIALYSEYDAADKCSDSDPGIVLHGNNPNREGIFFAPRSRVTLDAQTGHVRGAFIGWSISIDGDAWTIEKWRPSGGAVGELERVALVR